MAKREGFVERVASTIWELMKIRYTGKKFLIESTPGKGGVGKGGPSLVSCAKSNQEFAK